MRNCWPRSLKQLTANEHRSLMLPSVYCAIGKIYSKSKKSRRVIGGIFVYKPVPAPAFYAA